MSEQNDLEWYPWYWQRWQRSRRVLRLSLAERGLYRELLDECWRTGWIPDDAGKLAELVFAPQRDVARLWRKVRPFFDVRPDRSLFHADLAGYRKAQKERHERAVRNGKKGGRPKATPKPAETCPKARDNLKESIRVEETLTTARPPRLSSGAAVPERIGLVVDHLMAERTA